MNTIEQGTVYLNASDQIFFFSSEYQFRGFEYRCCVHHHQKNKQPNFFFWNRGIYECRGILFFFFFLSIFFGQQMFFCLLHWCLAFSVHPQVNYQTCALGLCVVIGTEQIRPDKKQVIVDISYATEEGWKYHLIIYS